LFKMKDERGIPIDNAVIEKQKTTTSNQE